MALVVGCEPLFSFSNYPFLLYMYIKVCSYCTELCILHFWCHNSHYVYVHMSPVKRICVFEHSVMTNFNYACQPFRGARDMAFCLKVPLDSLLVWASSEGSGETTRMRRLAWTFAARIGNKYQIHLTRSIYRERGRCGYFKIKSFSLEIGFPF